MTNGPGPGSVAIAPDGHSLYVANPFGNSVSQFNVQTRTGRLTAMRPGKVQTGVDPWESRLPRPGGIHTSRTSPRASLACTRSSGARAA